MGIASWPPRSARRACSTPGLDLVFTFAEAEYARGRQAGGRDAMTACHRALGVASAAEVRATIAPLYGKPDYVDAVLRSLDALAGRAEGGERS